MKKKLAFLAALAAICFTTNAATMVTYDKPMIAANEYLMSSQLSWLTHAMPESWSTSKINFSNVFGVDFDAGAYEVKVMLLGSNFGITADGTNVNRYNAYGVEGSMNKVLSGVSYYTGMESYITYDAGEALSLLAFGHVFEETYDIFNNNTPSFTWTTTELETQYFTNKNGQQVLVTDTLTTLLVGFDDSPGIWDNDFNDLILGIQIIPQNAAPSGQPLPGVVAALLLGSGVVAFKRKKMNTAK